MGLETQVISAALKALTSDKKINRKDKSIIKDILKKSGAKNPTASDVNNFMELASSLDDDKLDKLRATLIGSPGEYLADTAVNAVTGASNAAAGMFRNNAARLAEGLLAANRWTTQRQEDLYGVSPYENIIRQQAANLLRKGENKAIVADTISDVVDKSYNKYASNRDKFKDMAAAELTNVPGSYYNYINGELSRADKRAARAAAKKRGK